MELAEAIAYLDDRVNLEAIVAGQAPPPTLDRIRGMVELMGEPQRAYPVIHLTGTNGKGSTARILTALLVQQGLSVGTYTSPNLERVNERLAWSGEPISDGALCEVLEAVAALEPLVARPLSRFEILTAAAFRWFADLAVDVAVIEVGLGGRWDATNVADGQVAVVTNVSLDHMDYLGPTLEQIAAEKSGIVKPGSHLVLGETDPALAAIFKGAGAAAVWERDRDFACTRNRVAHGGRLLELRTAGATYEDLYLSLHGGHQGDNAAVAVAAAEAFFGAPLAGPVVADALGSVQVPGRLEVVGRQPLCVLDGAHNPAGGRAAAEAVAETFGEATNRILVVGMLRGREPLEMLDALDAGGARLVVACPPDWPRAVAPEEIAAAAAELGATAMVAASVPEALTRAFAAAEPTDLVLVTGSLYVVGEARAVLTRSPAANVPRA